MDDGVVIPSAHLQPIVQAALEKSLVRTKLQTPSAPACPRKKRGTKSVSCDPSVKIPMILGTPAAADKRLRHHWKWLNTVGRAYELMHNDLLEHLKIL